MSINRLKRNGPPFTPKAKSTDNKHHKGWTFHPTKGWRREWYVHRKGLITGQEWKYRGVSFLTP